MSNVYTGCPLTDSKSTAYSTPSTITRRSSLISIMYVLSLMVVAYFMAASGGEGTQGMEGTGMEGMTNVFPGSAAPASPCAGSGSSALLSKTVTVTVYGPASGTGRLSA